jgi:hypothetical protein
MALATPKQIKEVDYRSLRQDTLVSVVGYYDAVDFGSGVRPQTHRSTLRTAECCTPT